MTELTVMDRAFSYSENSEFMLARKRLFDANQSAYIDRSSS